MNLERVDYKIVILGIIVILSPREGSKICVCNNDYSLLKKSWWILNTVTINTAICISITYDVVDSVNMNLGWTYSHKNYTRLSW